MNHEPWTMHSAVEGKWFQICTRSPRPAFTQTALKMHLLGTKIQKSETQEYKNAKTQKYFSKNIYKNYKYNISLTASSQTAWCIRSMQPLDCSQPAMDSHSISRLSKTLPMETEVSKNLAKTSLSKKINVKAF